MNEEALRALSQMQRDGSCLIRIRTHRASLTAAEQRIADYILSHAEEVLNIPISTLASRCNVSDATVFRFSQTLGFDGFPQLKAALAVDLLTPGAADSTTISPGASMGEIVQKLIILISQGVFDTFAVLPEVTLNQAVSVLCASDRVEVYGAGGTSGPLSELVAYRFLNLGLRATGIRMAELMLKRAASLDVHGVAFGISHSGIAVPVVEALKIARERGATTICLTNYARSPITQVSDIVLQTAARESPRPSEAVAARIIQFAVLDAIYSGVAVSQFSSSLSGGEEQT